MSDIESLDSEVHSRSSLQEANSVAPYRPEVTQSRLSRRTTLVRRLSSAASSYLQFDRTDHEEDETFLDDAMSGSSMLFRSMGSPDDIESEVSENERVRRESIKSQQLQPPEQPPVPPTEPSPPEKFLHRRGLTAHLYHYALKVGMIDETYSKSEFTLVVQVFKNYFILAICLLAILSMYWGVYHDRAAHYTRIHYAIINADEGDIVGPIVESFFANTSAIQSLGTYDFLDLTELETLASSNNHSLDAEVYRQVHHQHYYGAFYVHQNATQAYLSNLKGQVELVGDSVLEIVYETGRDYSVMTGGVVPIIASINKVFYQYIAQTPLIPALMNQLTDDEISQVVSANPELITSLPTFKFSDLRPIPLLIFQAPLSVGVIYLVAFAFFQFLFMTPVHQRVAESVKGFKYMVYRFVVAQIAYIVISLGYVVVNSAFGMAYDTTFGHSGFLVIWMFAFLVMSSLGSTIETLILCLVPNRIQFAGVVLVLNIVLNLSPTVGTIALTPVFYRYGYAIPVFNAYHLMHVAYFDVWKGDIGRYIGILCAWIVVWNILLPLSMLRVVRKMARIKKKAIEQKLAQETEQMVLQEQQEKVSTQN